MIFLLELHSNNNILKEKCCHYQQSGKMYCRGFRHTDHSIRWPKFNDNQRRRRKVSDAIYIIFIINYLCVSEWECRLSYSDDKKMIAITSGK